MSANLHAYVTTAFIPILPGILLPTRILIAEYGFCGSSNLVYHQLTWYWLRDANTPNPHYLSIFQIFIPSNRILWMSIANTKSHQPVTWISGGIQLVRSAGIILLSIKHPWTSSLQFPIYQYSVVFPYSHPESSWTRISKIIILQTRCLAAK